jgi:hypothetical protein
MQQPRVVRTDSCCGGERVVRADSCCGGQAQDVPFEQRADLGRQRRVLVRRVALTGSAVLTLAALAVLAIGGTGMVVLADRLAWAGSVWAAGLVLGWIRAAITARRFDWRLPLAVAAIAAGIVWQPLVPALVAVALLTERLLRPPQATTSTSDRAGAGSLSATAGQPG